MKNLLQNGFNTSHVVVYPISVEYYTRSFYRFNTSHVVVYQTYYIDTETGELRFNTSHVVVYRNVSAGSA